MKKLLSILLVSLLIFSLAACSQETATNDEPQENQEETNNEETPEVVTTASIVNENAAFVNAISAEGNWIIATLTDLTFEDELVVDGEFRNKGDETKDLYRKLALYTQDSDHNVTGEFTLTAPKLTVKSPNFRMQNGTFVGDIYVEANGFNLKGAKVEGNIYFANEEFKTSFENNEGEVTGEMSVVAE